MDGMKNARFDRECDTDKSPAIRKRIGTRGPRACNSFEARPDKAQIIVLKKEVNMHQLIKAMTVAGMVASGLPLLTEAANAQTAYTWYQFTPLYCEPSIWPRGDGSASTSLIIAVNLNGSAYYINVPDSHVISAIF